MANPLHKFRVPKEKIAALDYTGHVKSHYQAAYDLGITSTKSMRDWRAIQPASERAVKKVSKKNSFNQRKTSKFQAKYASELGLRASATSALHL